MYFSSILCYSNTFKAFQNYPTLIRATLSSQKAARPRNAPPHPAYRRNIAIYGQPERSGNPSLSRRATLFNAPALATHESHSAAPPAASASGRPTRPARRISNQTAHIADLAQRTLWIWTQCQPARPRQPTPSPYPTSHAPASAYPLYVRISPLAPANPTPANAVLRSSVE